MGLTKSPHYIIGSQEMGGGVLKISKKLSTWFMDNSNQTFDVLYFQFVMWYLRNLNFFSHRNSFKIEWSLFKKYKKYGFFIKKTMFCKILYFYKHSVEHHFLEFECSYVNFSGKSTKYLNMVSIF